MGAQHRRADSGCPVKLQWHIRQFMAVIDRLMHYKVEMTMGMGFPTGMGITQWESHGNGNKT